MKKINFFFLLIVIFSIQICLIEGAEEDRAKVDIFPYVQKKYLSKRKPYSYIDENQKTKKGKISYCYEDKLNDSEEIMCVLQSNQAKLKVIFIASRLRNNEIKKDDKKRSLETEMLNANANITRMIARTASQSDDEVKMSNLASLKPEDFPARQKNFQSKKKYKYYHFGSFEKVYESNIEIALDAFYIDEFVIETLLVHENIDLNKVGQK